MSVIKGTCQGVLCDERKKLKQIDEWNFCPKHYALYEKMSPEQRYDPKRTIPAPGSIAFKLTVKEV
jgi:hypothetical protein